MKIIKIQIPQEIVNNIQLKDFEVASMQAVIANILETHAFDKDARVVKSPVFIGYQDKLVQIKKEFEDAKDNMLITFIDKDTRTKVMNWSLDYSSYTLTLQVKE